MPLESSKVSAPRSTSRQRVAGTLSNLCAAWRISSETPMSTSPASARRTRGPCRSMVYENATATPPSCVVGLRRTPRLGYPADGHRAARRVAAVGGSCVSYPPRCVNGLVGGRRSGRTERAAPLAVAVRTMWREGTPWRRGSGARRRSARSCVSRPTDAETLVFPVGGLRWHVTRTDVDRLCRPFPGLRRRRLRPWPLLPTYQECPVRGHLGAAGHVVDPPGLREQVGAADHHLARHAPSAQYGHSALRAAATLAQVPAGGRPGRHEPGLTGTPTSPAQRGAAHRGPRGGWHYSGSALISASTRAAVSSNQATASEIFRSRSSSACTRDSRSSRPTTGAGRCLVMWTM